MQVLSLFILTLIISSSAFSSTFNDDVKGFYLALGVGYGQLDYENSSGSESESGLATNFRIGYGFNEQFALYYDRSATTSSTNGNSYVEGVTGIGAAYYFKPSVPTAFITATFGEGDLTDVDSSDSELGSGKAFSLGYRFKTHQSVEIKLVSMELDDFDYESDAIQFVWAYTFL